MSLPVPDRSLLSPALATKVDDLCDRFEAAWKAGERPSLEAYLAGVPEPAHATAAWELLRVEAFYRRRAGEEPAPSDYQAFVPFFDTLRLAGALTPGVHATAPAEAREFGVRTPVVTGYEILHVLGRGGMGVVYKARQVSLNRTVALKMILTGTHAGPEELSRFRREAETAARLQHPNIVQIHEVGEWRESEGAHPQPYIALEYVGGGSLSDYLRGVPQPPRVMARYVETLARALDHIHAQGIVHRDLKPANILLSFVEGPLPVGAGATAPQLVLSNNGLPTAIPKITDFGLAKLGYDSDLTRTGDALGSPSYMAPEQINGDGSLIGPATDVYGLGAILYETLTGRPPFKAETPLATVHQVRHDEPLPPRTLVPTLPRDLETICLKCLAKEPRRRYASAVSLAEDLGHFLAGEPILARPTGAVERLGRWCRRNPALAALAAALAVAVVGGFAGITRLWLVADANRQLAEANFNDANRERAKAEDNFRLARKAVDDFALKVSNDRRLRSSHRPLRKELLQTAVQFYEQFVALRSDDPNVRAELGNAFRQLGEMVREVEDPGKAIACYEKARDLFTELDRGDPDNVQYLAGLAACDYSLSLLYQDTGRDADCERSSLMAIDLLKQLTARFPNNPQYALDLARGHTHHGLFLQRAGKYTSAEAEHQEALGLLQRLRADHPHEERVATVLAGSHNFLGLLYASLKKRSEAVREYGAALDIQRQMDANADGEDFQNHTAATLNNLGLVYHQDRKYADAEREFLAAARINRALAAKLPEVTQYHHFLAANCSNLGLVCRDTQRPDEAVAHYEEANAILRRLIAKQPKVPAYVSELAHNVSAIGHVQKNAGRTQEALARFDEAIQILEQVRRQSASDTFSATALRNAHWRRADSLDALGRHREAVLAWEQALALDEGVEKDQLRLYRARSVARAGDYRAATVAVEALPAPQPSDGKRQMELAGFFAIVARAIDADTGLPANEREELKRRCTGRAVAFVTAAKASGYFQNAERLHDLKNSKDFAPLRHNPEFQAIIEALQAK